MEQVPTSLNRRKLEDNSTRTGCMAPRGNIFHPSQFPRSGGRRVKATYELAFTPFKVHYHLGYGQSGTHLVGYNAEVITWLTTGVGVRL